MKKLFAVLTLTLMLVAPLSCDKADNNKKENSYSEQDENGNGKESGGEETSGLSLQADWTAEVTSVGTDEYGRRDQGCRTRIYIPGCDHTYRR